jgi:hypothetical protein
MSDFEARFWAKVEKTDGCWLWRGAKSSGGYGCIGWDGKIVGAHRASWLLRHGIIPGGLHVLHKCDTPACVNPAHLFLGTNLDNMKDRNAKGRCRSRGLPGDRAARRKLASVDVIDIRAMVADGVQQKDVARIYGVHKATVNDLVLRKTWASIP